jgi:hypothetical protein
MGRVVHGTSVAGRTIEKIPVVGVFEVHQVAMAGAVAK